MTVSTTTVVKKYTGDGSTVAFPTEFVFDTQADIEVVERVIATGVETVKALTTDYTVSGGGGGDADPATGTVTAVVAPAATVEWHLRRIVADTQAESLPSGGALPSPSIENAVDRLAMMSQQHAEENLRSLRFPKTDSATLSGILPNSIDRADMGLKFDSNGDPAVFSLDNITDGFANGAAAAPSRYCANDSDNGFYLPSADVVGLSVGGSQLVGFTVSQIQLIQGSESTPPYSFLGDTDTGMFLSADNQIGFSTEGIVNFEVVSGGSSVVNQMRAQGAATGSPPQFLAQGDDANIDFGINPKGSGLMQLLNAASWTANGSQTITISNVGPAGIGTATIGKWLTVKDNAGATYFIPAWT